MAPGTPIGILYDLNPVNPQQTITSFFQQPFPERSPTPQTPERSPTPSTLEPSTPDQFTPEPFEMASPAESSTPSNATPSSSTFLESLTAEVVILNIGTGPLKATVRVHRDVVSEKSPVLARLLNPTEGLIPNELNLPDETATYFGHLLEYIYKGKVMSASEPAVKAEESNETEITAPPAPMAPSPTINGQTKRHITNLFKAFAIDEKYKPLFRFLTRAAPEVKQAWAAQIEQDIDFGFMQTKLVQGVYKNLADVDRDFDLLHQNHLAFHGPNHNFTRLASEFRTLFQQKTGDMRRGTSSAAPSSSQPQASGSGPIAGYVPPTLLQQQLSKMAQLSIPLPAAELLDLYILATKYKVTGLMDLCMTSLISTHIQSSTFATISELILAFKSVPKGCPLRFYMAKTICFHLLAYKERENDPPESLNRTDNLLELVTQNSELGFEVFKMLRVRNGLAFSDPRYGGFCEFHVHSRDGKCSLGRVNGRKRRIER
ncbi:hypothetical protein EG329_013855 [Mollisiaceae sp. DMI_Dod_QoI]|nr:hypothetical protein EG329_013855 [Helotiales sp. DMI_Dod_QoI]